MFIFSTGRISTDPPTSRNRAAFRRFHRVRDVPRIDDHKAADDILCLGKGAVVNGLCLLLTSLPASLRGCPGYLMWLFSFNSLSQATHFCIVFCVWSGDAVSISAAKQQGEFAHCPHSLRLIDT
jgi:hypothetical protein